MAPGAPLVFKCIWSAPDHWPRRVHADHPDGRQPCLDVASLEVEALAHLVGDGGLALHDLFDSKIGTFPYRGGARSIEYTTQVAPGTTTRDVIAATESSGAITVFPLETATGRAYVRSSDGTSTTYGGRGPGRRDGADVALPGLRHPVRGGRRVPVWARPP